MSDAPVLLHESTGLRIVKNPVNQFCIVTLHHTADPAKRSPEWRREAAAGMTPEKFAKEYDIDYTAVMGAKVFPEITSNRANIVVQEPYPDFGHRRYWGGFDYGTRNPSSFHVYTIDDGIVYSVWELYKPCKNIPDFVEEMKACPYWDQIRYIAADPNLWAPTQQQKNGNPISVQELFYRAGVKIFVKGIQDEDAWTSMMREHWKDPNDVTFKIFSRCANQIREFETCIYINQSERQLLTQSYREQIADIDNHSLDDCKYFMLSRPSQQAHSLWKDPIMVNRWAQAPNNKATSRKPIGGYA